jgi:hypothetical protein
MLLTTDSAYLCTRIQLGNIERFIGITRTSWLAEVASAPPAILLFWRLFLARSSFYELRNGKGTIVHIQPHFNFFLRVVKEKYLMFWLLQMPCLFVTCVSERQRNWLRNMENMIMLLHLYSCKRELLSCKYYCNFESCSLGYKYSPQTH